MAVTAHDSSNEHVLEVESVGFSYGTKVALADISFRISAGETAFLLGPNGAGKSTLFSLICGLFQPQTGSVTVESHTATKPSALARLGIVFQSDTLDPDLSIADNLAYYAALHGFSSKDTNQRIQTVLQPMELADRKQEKVRTLNGGHRRRVDIARALMHNPRLLLLDEPTVGLDVPTRHALTQRLRSLAATQQCAVLWATHLVDEVTDDDRVLLMHQSQLHGDDIASALMSSHNVSSLSELMKLIIKKPNAEADS